VRWTRQRFARDGIAGRVGERPVSDQQRADERCSCVRRSRVVLTPRRWRQVRGVASARPGLDKTYPLGDGGKRARSPGRARRKPLKPLRAGMPGDAGVLVVTRVRSTTTSAHEAAGATGTRRSPRPLWADDSAKPRAHRAARLRTLVFSMEPAVPIEELLNLDFESGTGHKRAGYPSNLLIPGSSGALKNADRY
jgi:hypothetical protein